MMKRVIFFGLIFLLAACGSDTNTPSTDTVAPAVPSNVKVLAGNAQATVTWQVNSENDLEGYTLYWGSAANNLAASVIVDKAASSKTVTGLTNDTPYFFAVSAEDTSGNKSKLSEPISTTPTANADTTPPTLQSSTPADTATDVPPRNPSITLVFSEPMNTTEFAFTIVPPFRASDASSDEKLELTWSNNDTTLTVKPTLSELVLENTSFTLTLTNAKDRTGDVLVGDNEITFTTGADVPRVVSSTPESGATNIGLDLSSIVLTFSTAVDTSMFTLETTFLTRGHNWSNDDTTLQIAVVALDNESTYTVSFSGKDKQGRAFSGSFSFSTIPDSGSPHVTATTPQDGAVNVSLIPSDDGIGIYFDDVMDAASTIAAVSSSLPLGCAWEFTNRLACLNPSLQANTTYIITIDTTAKDTSGNPLSREFCRGSFPCAYSFKFSTGSTIDETRPTINTEFSEPDNGATDVEIGSTINVIFSEKMNQESVERVFRADTGDTEIVGTFGWFNSGMVFFPSSSLPSCTNIHVTITTEATDRALNILANPYNITFKTICN
jgi:Bacterial Ig-like domain/Fibronectin type III domain